MRDLFADPAGMDKPLRPHQADAITLVRNSLLGTGIKRVVCAMPTGAGKTRFAAELVNMANARGNRVAFTVPALSLIDQTIESFENEGIFAINVMQGNHPRKDPNAKVHVISVQTLAKRERPDVGMVIVDECHIRSRVISQWMQDCPKTTFIGLSATPWSRGMADEWQALVSPVTIQQLIDAGYLSPFRVFAPTHPDLTAVRVKAGDYHEGDLSAVMSDNRLVADVVTTWKQRAAGLPTLVFAVDRAHAEKLQSQFAAGGVPMGYCDAHVDRVARRMLFAQMARGEIAGICNIGTLCLDDKTEILTRQGWRSIDAIQPTDDIAAWSPGGIEFTKPLGIVKRDRQPDEKMVVVSGGTNDVRVTGNHRMVYWGGVKNQKLKVESAESLVGRRLEIPISGIAEPWRFVPTQECDKAMARRSRSLTYKYRSQGIPAQVAREMADEFHARRYGELATKDPDRLSLDECAFIGFWVGDGTRSQGRFALAQSYKYPKIIKWVDDLLARLRLNFTRAEYPPARKGVFASVRWNLSTGRGGREQAVSGGLSPLMDYLDKSGSDLLWGLNGEQFRAFLHGYWLADGNHGCGEVPEGNGKRLYIADERMADLIQAIAACRGIGTHKTWKGHIWVVSFRDADRGYYATHRLQIEDLPFTPERVWCVTSTTSYLIVRRNGKVQVIGNTTGVDADVRCVVLARPTKSEMLFTQMIGRGLRVAPGKSECVIIDHADNHARLGFVTDIHHEKLLSGSDKTPPTAREKGESTPKECPKCGVLLKSRECFACGFVAQRVSEVEPEAGELVEVKARKPKATAQDKQKFWSMALHLDAQRGKGGKLALALYKAKFDVWPRGMSGDRLPPDAEFMAYEHSRRIARSFSKRGVAA